MSRLLLENIIGMTEQEMSHPTQGRSDWQTIWIRSTALRTRKEKRMRSVRDLSRPHLSLLAESHMSRNSKMLKKLQQGRMVTVRTQGLMSLGHSTVDSAVPLSRNVWIGQSIVALMPLLPATLGLRLRDQLARRNLGRHRLPLNIQGSLLWKHRRLWPLRSAARGSMCFSNAICHRHRSAHSQSGCVLKIPVRARSASMLLRREGRFLRREGGFLRRGGGFLRRWVSKGNRRWAVSSEGRWFLRKGGGF